MLLRGSLPSDVCNLMISSSIYSYYEKRFLRGAVGDQFDLEEEQSFEEPQKPVIHSS
jgi:hypothetical protein